MTGSRDGEMTLEEERERDELEEALALIRAAEEKYPSNKTETFEEQTLRLAIELSLEDEALKKAETETEGEGEPGASFDGHTGEDDEFAQAVSLQRRIMREQAGAVARRRPTLDRHLSVNQRASFHTSFSDIQLEEADSVVEINSVDQEKCDLEVSTRNLNARHVVSAEPAKDGDESVVDVDTVGGETCDVEVRTRNMNVRRRSMTHMLPNQEPPELLERLQRLDVSVASRRSSISARTRTSEERRGTSEVQPSPRSTSRLRWSDQVDQEIEEISSSMSRLREVGQHRREQRAAKQAEFDEAEGQQSQRNGVSTDRSSSRHSRRPSSRRRSRRSAEVSGGASAITAPTVMFGESSEDKKLSEGEMEEIVRALMEAGASPAELARVFHSRSG
eukprot:scaffold73723_cov67-Attheya_sp.AAC.4